MNVWHPKLVCKYTLREWNSTLDILETPIKIFEKFNGSLQLE